MHKTTIGYTCGAYDLFHIGHLNILKNAKALCDKLIVAVSTDELVESYKLEKPVIPFEERMEIIRNIGFVDAVVPQIILDKFEAWKSIKYDILVMGQDWSGNENWKGYERKLNKKGAKVIFLPRTQRISTSSLLRKLRPQLFQDIKTSDWKNKYTYKKVIIFNESEIGVKGAKLQLINIPSGEKLKPHYHKKITEIFSILSGNGIIKINGKEVKEKIILCKPNDTHSFDNNTNGDLVILISKWNEDEKDIFWTK